MICRTGTSERIDLWYNKRTDTFLQWMDSGKTSQRLRVSPALLPTDFDTDFR